MPPPIPEMPGDSRRVAVERSVALALKACVASVVEQPGNPRGDSPLRASPEMVAALRRCIYEYAHTLRLTDERPERVLIGFKEIVQNVVPAALNADAFKRAAISWCIEAYYAPIDGIADQLPGS